MHELGITENIITQIYDECKARKIKLLKKAYVELGNLTTYKKSSMVFYFNELKKNYKGLEKAKLVIRTVPGKVKCFKCKKESKIKDACLICCKHCTSHEVKIIDGQNVVVKQIEW
jgi:hydrogenase nickel insertion protein HypA